MLIDWFTVIAQIINFLILMWLLKRFLYKPILQAVDARDKKIKAQLQEAEQKMQQATTERKTYEQKNAEFDQQRQAMLKTATDEVMGKRKALLFTLGTIFQIPAKGVTHPFQGVPRREYGCRRGEHAGHHVGENEGPDILVDDRHL